MSATYRCCGQPAEGPHARTCTRTARARKEAPGQGSLFDPLGVLGEEPKREPRRTPAQEAGDRAVQAVGTSHADWVEKHALPAIRETAHELREFTTDEVWKRIRRVPGIERRAMGAAMRKAQAMGICKPTPRYETSEREACHGRPVRVWRAT